jgi:hypothetical protein
MIAVDTSVLIDVLTDDPQHGEASLSKLQGAMESDDVVVCDVVLAEVATLVEPVDELLDTIAELGLTYSPITAQAAVRAGVMYRRFRARGGGPERIAADFLVGAHALLAGATLITRDRGFFRDYFKGLRIICPA